MQCEHGKGHQGAPGSSSKALPKREAGVVASAASLGSDRIHKESVSKERSVLLLMCQALYPGQDVPACSENMCGPRSSSFSQRSLPAEIRTKDTDS